MEPEYEYNMKTRSLAKDTRYYKPHMLDVDSSYKEFQEYSKSELHRYVKKAENLLSNSIDISPEQLKSALSNNYGIEGQMVDEVLHQIISNDKNVDVSKQLH